MERRREAVKPHPPSLSVVRQCELLNISRSGLYNKAKGISDEDMALMKLIDRQYLATPFFGARKIAASLKSKNKLVNWKHVRRLMWIMGIRAIYRQPRTSKAAPENKIYPYLLRSIEITRPNQVWCADITLYPDGARVHVPGSHNGLVYTICALLEIIEYHGFRLLC